MEDRRQTDAKQPGAEAESTFRRVQHTLPFRMLLRGFLVATKYLPVWFLRLVGFFVALIFVLFNPANFRAIMGNLAVIRPGMSGARCAAMAFGVFKNYAFYLIDLFHISHDPSRIRGYRVTFSGLEHLDEALASGKGIVMLTSHLGNWEIGGLLLGLRGRKLHVVYSPDSSGILEEQRRFIRDIEAVEEIPLSRGGFSSLRLLRVLQERGIVALQGDRLTFDSGMTMPFFGKEARFPKGPVKLALAADSLILPVFMPISGYKSYNVVIERPVAPERSGTGREELRTNLRKIITILEKQIGRHATQWYAFMPFWEEHEATPER